MKSMTTLNFQVIPGIQPGREFFIAMWTLRRLNLIPIWNERELPPDVRAQLILNQARFLED